MRLNLVVLLLVAVLCALGARLERGESPTGDTESLSDRELIAMLPPTVNAVAVARGPFTPRYRRKGEDSYEADGFTNLTCVMMPILTEIRDRPALSQHVKAVVAGVRVGELEHYDYGAPRWGRYGDFCSVIVIDADAIEGLESVGRAAGLPEVRVLGRGIVAFASSKTFLERIGKPGLVPGLLAFDHPLPREARFWGISTSKGVVEVVLQASTVSVAYTMDGPSGRYLHERIEQLKAAGGGRSDVWREDSFEVKQNVRPGISEATFPLNGTSGFILSVGIGSRFGCFLEPP